MKLTVVTNIPALIIDIWNGFGSLVVEQKYTASDSVTYLKPSRTVFELPKGLYQVRFSAPYFNDTGGTKNAGGSLFTMPLYMDEYVALDKDYTITFNTQLKTTIDDTESDSNQSSS